MKKIDFYTPTSSYIGQVRILFAENPRETRVMTETELKARDQFSRLFYNVPFDNDTYDYLFKFVMKNIEHCDKLQPLKQRDLK
jgi:hypothetical protein